MKVEIDDDLFPLNGHAPGSYLNRCAFCGHTFTGDKLCRTCINCALRVLKDNSMHAVNLEWKKFEETKNSEANEHNID